MPVTSYVTEGLEVYRLNYIEKKYFVSKVTERVLIPTNPLLNMPLMARETFEIFKNPISLKGSGYPHITVIRAFSHREKWCALDP